MVYDAVYLLSTTACAWTVISLYILLKCRVSTWIDYIRLSFRTMYEMVTKSQDQLCLFLMIHLTFNLKPDIYADQ